jgi:hypothetical protein
MLDSPSKFGVWYANSGASIAGTANIYLVKACIVTREQRSQDMITPHDDMEESRQDQDVVLNWHVGRVGYTNSHIIVAYLDILYWVVGGPRG